MGTPPRENPRRVFWRFTLRFFAIVFALSALSRIDHAAWDSAGSHALTRTSAALVATSFSLLGRDVHRFQDTIHFRGAAFKIIDECTGIEVVALFAAAVLAFPSSWRLRLIGLCLWTPALLLLNLIRMITLVWLGSASARALEYGHVYVWPVIVLTFTLASWLHWARSATRETDFGA